MKRYISLILALLTVLSLTLPVYGLECGHSYLSVSVPASCVEKGHTLYTCENCNDTYKVYDDEYTAPESFYILAESTRADSTLTVTVSLGNNPGLIAARIRLGYNASTLSLREFINGEVWTSRDFTGGINTGNNPLTVFTEDYSTGEQNNTKNGVYFTVVFDIIDPDGSYDVSLTHNKADFPSWKGLTSNTPKIINLVGKSELGPHSYTAEDILPTCDEGGYVLHTCGICSDTMRTDETDPLGHSFEFSREISAPDFENEGIHEYACTECGTAEERTVPVLEHWIKGDLNGDTKINAMDSNIIRRLIAGSFVSVQAIDAADLNDDSKLNAIDANLMKFYLSGAN